MGWIRKPIDTGLLDIRSLFTGTTGEGGAATLRRVREQVTLTVMDLPVGTTPGWLVFSPMLAAGFRPWDQIQPFLVIDPVSGVATHAEARTGGAVGIWIRNGLTAVSGSVTFPTPDAWPSSYPGSEVQS